MGKRKDEEIIYRRYKIGRKVRNRKDERRTGGRGAVGEG